MVRRLRTIGCGTFRPFWPKSNEEKGAKGWSTSPQAQVGLKPQVGPPEPNFGPKSQQSQNCQKDPRNKIEQEPQFGQLHPMAPGSPQRLPAHLQKGFSSNQGKNFPSFMDPIPKDPGMVYTWYNIQLCTIFSQKSNGDFFRTQVFHSNASPKSITHFKGRLFNHSVLQSLVASRRPFEDLNHLALQELGGYLISGLFKG
ncbi:hypothetical protein O181_066472 [Austropuccinia psidii MF-1]|uniref:Uncharacterized protein n=1 Tax=Austropuccinia psidii MF-1 TaxID=1389203 RepID=A0A9Q3EZ61_9BASI|nr:hypothetical protein [Austropuccinia psidii MF-1]